MFFTAFGWFFFALIGSDLLNELAPWTWKVSAESLPAAFSLSENRAA